MILTLPYPPSLNNMYPTGSHGGRFLGIEGKRYKRAAQQAFNEQRGEYIEGEVSIRMVLYMPRRCDIDNRVKAVWDALSGLAFRDDIEVARYEVRREKDTKNPRVEVEITQA